MLVLHGIWAYSALWLWAEDPLAPPQAPPRGGRPSRAPRPHPFTSPAAVLADALAQSPGPLADLARKAVEDELTLYLPGTAAGPLASPDLIRSAALALPSSILLNSVRSSSMSSSAGSSPGAGLARSGRHRPVLAGWRIPALTFGAEAAAKVLAALAEAGGADRALAARADRGGGVTGGGVVLAGGSVPYLAAVAGLAASLVRRGRLLPQLCAEDDGYAARWRPVLTGADARRAAELAAAMPPLCRAVTPAGEPPAALIAAALDSFTDAAARDRLAGLVLRPGRGRKRPDTVLPERWLAALTATEPGLGLATPDEEPALAGLSAVLAEWRVTAQTPAGPVRTCFRLIEPEFPDPVPDDGTTPEAGVIEDRPAGDEAAWRVEFSLQSSEDPSLIMPAADIWAGTAGWAPGLGHPEEELLAGLGTAARLFPELEAELDQARPEQVTLDTDGASRFLRHTASLLAGAGFGVLLPDWARKARIGLRLTARSRATPGAAAVTEASFGMRDLVHFRYELAVGDDALDPDELAELARRKIPLVRIRGQWVELDERHLQAALRFLDRHPAGARPASEALLAGLDGPEELPPITVDAQGWLADLLSGQADQRLTPLPAPPGFRGQLRPYQERGLAWMAFLGQLGVGLILADDMGLGKTIELLSLLAHERGLPATPPADVPRPDVPAPGPTLLVCPMSLAGNWQREAERFVPGLSVHVHHGAGRLTGDELTQTLAAADLVITTYAIATRDVSQLATVPWARVVCDEAQNIKNHASRQAQAVRALPAATRIALTGTPVENRLSELWSIMDFTNLGLLGPAGTFRTRFAIPIERHGDAEAAERLRRITAPFILRRLKTDTTIISDLPDKQEMKVFCNLTPEQASLYQATVADMLARVEAAEGDIQRRGLVLATMAKLKQVCNHPAHLLGDGSRLPGRSGKLARLEEIGDEIVADGDKALCFTQYAEFGGLLEPYLAARLGCPVLFLHGGTPKKRRDEMVASFAGITGPALFLLSLKAGGTGLNLTAARHVIHIDRWWNPAVEDQATDRAFRIGQTRNVQVRKFICVGTLEERIDAMIEEKKALAERIVGTGESWLAGLSASRLREVVALAPEAVSQ